MDAMILAAGLGTRLGEVTRHIPKALVEVAGLTALERVARALIDAGADRLIINVHHHADLVIEHVHERDDFGVEVLFSREEEGPLETGGGLLHAAPLFRGDAPFLLHNVDVLCDADLRALYQAHVRATSAADASGSARAAPGADSARGVYGGHGAGATTAPLATLAVNRRPSSRLLLFDGDGLCGRVDGRTGERSEVRPPAADAEAFAFAGIHVISPALLDAITERGAFSIMDVYLRLAAAGEAIAHHDISDAEWLEIGSPARLDAARRALGS